MDFKGMTFKDGNLVRQAMIDLGEEDGRWVCPAIQGKESPGSEYFSYTFLKELYQRRLSQGVDPISGTR